MAQYHPDIKQTRLPTIPMSVFRTKNTEQLRELGSCHITGDGEYIGTFIVARNDYIYEAIQEQGVMNKVVGG